MYPDRRLRPPSWSYGDTSHPIVVERRLTVLESRMERGEERLDEIEDSLYEAAFLAHKEERIDMRPKRKGDA